MQEALMQESSAEALDDIVYWVGFFWEMGGGVPSRRGDFGQGSEGAGSPDAMPSLWWWEGKGGGGDRMGKVTQISDKEMQRAQLPKEGGGGGGGGGGGLQDEPGNPGQ